MGRVELLIFTSKLLHVDSQRELFDITVLNIFCLIIKLDILMISFLGTKTVAH